MSNWLNELYVYCTDFIINLANISALSYYEVNTLIFCLLYPTMITGLLAVYLIQKRRLLQAKGNNNLNP